MNNSVSLPSGHRRIDHGRMIGITKQFPGVLANDQVDFDVRAGEIHALLGENGAGKSTLMRQLYGLYKPDRGEIHLNGQAVDIRSPSDALAQGIGMIHQHFMLVPTLTVTENIALGLRDGPLLDLARARGRLLEPSEVSGLQVDPDAGVWQLSGGEQQRGRDIGDRADRRRIENLALRHRLRALDQILRGRVEHRRLGVGQEAGGAA